MNKLTLKMKFLSVTEIFEYYPTLQAETGWSKDDIISFYEGHLLIGNFVPELSTKPEDLKINTDSLDKLIAYHKNLRNSLL